MSDPWSLLGLEPAFGLDRGVVERAYRTRLASAHPDASGDQSDAAALNEARAILLDAERRADALVVLLGGPSREACRDLPDGFLSEIMGIRLEIEEQEVAERDDAHWQAWADERRDAHITRAGELFGSLATAPKADDLLEIRRELNAWRYIERLREQLDSDFDPMSPAGPA